MAKIQVYKFVNYGAIRSTAPTVVAAKQSLLATNRLGKTIHSVGKEVVDINKLTSLRLKTMEKADIAERRAKRRQMDQEAEELQESIAGKKNLSEYFKKKSKLRYKKSDFGAGISKMMKGAFGWVQPLLGPFVSLFTKLGAALFMKELLEWASDESNIEAMTVFLEKTAFVFEKIYGFGEWIIKDNLLDGFDKLFGSDSSFLGRVEGFGKMMTGIIGLKYLMNPFSIITDIIFLANILAATRFIPGKGACLPKGRNFKPNLRNNKVNLKRTISGGRQMNPGPFSGVREWFRKFRTTAGNKVTQGTTTGKNLFGRLSDGVKKAVTPNKVTQSGSGNIFTKSLNNIKNIFKKSKVTSNVTPNIKVKPNINIKPNNIIKPKTFNVKPKAGGGPLGILLGIALDIGIQAGFGSIEQKKFENYLIKFEAMSKDEQLKEIQRRTRIRDYAKSRTEGAYGVFQEIITGGGWLGTNFNKETFERETNYLKAMHQIMGTVDSSAMNQNEYEQFYENVPEKNKDVKGNSFDKLNPKNDRKWWNPTTWFKAEGGELPEFIFGGIFRGIKRAVSGVVNTVSKVVSGVVNTVTNVVSNPIISTALSFVPGIGPIVGAINAVSNLAQGNILGAITSGIGAVGQFANINTVNAINQPRWMQNLRFSKFGKGLSNLYFKGANAFSAASSFLSNTVGAITDSRIGKIGMKLLGGNTGGAIGEVVGMIPGLQGRMEGFGNWLEKNQLQGILGAVPGVSGLLKNIPNVMSIPGMEKILGGEGYGFSASRALGSVADRFGMGGIYAAIMSGAQSGDYVQGLRELAPELGVDPRILGVLDKGRALLSNNKFNAEYAMQTAIEFLPVPLIVEKLIPAPTPVPINSGDTYLVAPSTTNSKK